MKSSIKKQDTVRIVYINQMKNNEKVPVYIIFFQLCYTKSPYPAYEILKLFLPYFQLMESAEEISFDPDYIDG